MEDLLRCRWKREEVKAEGWKVEEGRSKGG
jgi:hypothetical protein